MEVIAAVSMELFDSYEREMFFKLSNALYASDLHDPAFVLVCSLLRSVRRVSWLSVQVHTHTNLFSFSFFFF